MKVGSLEERNKWIELMEKVMNEKQYKLPEDEDVVATKVTPPTLIDKLPFKGFIEAIRTAQQTVIIISFKKVKI